MPFPQAPAGARQILSGWRRSGWLLCCGRSCWWCSRRMTKRSSPAGSGWASQWEKGTKTYHSFWSQTWVSLDLWAGTKSCCHTQGLPPDCTRGSPDSSAHPGTLWCWLSSWLRRCEIRLVIRQRTSPTWPPTTPKLAWSLPIHRRLWEKSCSQFRIRIEMVIEAEGGYIEKMSALLHNQVTWIDFFSIKV